MYSDRVSGTWAPGSNTTFHPARTIRWRELTGLKHLADGAMCSCYTAHLAGHGTVVVKKPSRRSNETLEEIERELDIEKAYLASLHHPNIVRLIGSGRRGIKKNFQPFLVLEYLSGNTLANLISKRRRGEFEIPHFVLDGKKNYIPWAQAMGWAQDMASALHYMHHEASPGYMYICRDLKPDNIGFAADGTLKMFDMGLAKRVARKSGTNQRYTMTSRCGTLRYMAPEAFLGCSYNETVDVYAWSHVVAEMLSLDVPYEHMGTHEFRATVVLGRRRPNLERRWPRSIQRLLRRCWDRDPAVRPSFGEILEAGVLKQAAGPQQSWFHHFSLRRPSSATSTRDEATAVANADQNLTERAPRGRVATIDLAGDPNHRSPAPQPEGASVAPVATLGDSEEEGAAEVGTRPNSTPARLIRLGPWALPVCFFGGGARA
ncbi:unnamed protein product [Ectocarpus sp. CCAP 1310/34]|nr:unnamed protein product [Ectocarpus sp. CCAP 1310/34]